MTAEGDALHVLRTTRSVRRRLDFERPVEPEVLEECIDVAVQAPTGLNREAWRFLVITEAEAKQRVATLYRSAFDAVSREWAALLPEGASEESPLASRPTYRALADRLHELPALILVCTLGRPPANNLALQVGFYGSVLPAAWSLMVALRARGIGSTWTTLLLREEVEVARALGIPADATPTVLLPVAYTRDAVLRPAPRRPAREVTYWNEWGQLRDER